MTNGTVVPVGSGSIGKEGSGMRWSQKNVLQCCLGWGMIDIYPSPLPAATAREALPQHLGHPQWTERNREPRFSFWALGTVRKALSVPLQWIFIWEGGGGGHRKVWSTYCVLNPESCTYFTSINTTNLHGRFYQLRLTPEETESQGCEASPPPPVIGTCWSWGWFNVCP